MPWIRNHKCETKESKPGTRNQKFETRDPNLKGAKLQVAETRVSKPRIRNQGAKRQGAETRESKPGIQNQGSETMKKMQTCFFPHYCSISLH